LTAGALEAYCNLAGDDLRGCTALGRFLGEKLRKIKQQCGLRDKQGEGTWAKIGELIALRNWLMHTKPRGYDTTQWLAPGTSIAGISLWEQPKERNLTVKWGEEALEAVRNGIAQINAKRKHPEENPFHFSYWSGWLANEIK
jgi:hypothetical protein